MLPDGPAPRHSKRAVRFGFGAVFSLVVFFVLASQHPKLIRWIFSEIQPSEQGVLAEAKIRAGMGAVSNDSIATHLKRITAVPHIAGTRANMETAAYVAAQMQNFGLEVRTSDFPVLLGNPAVQSVSILNGPSPSNLSLREASFDEDPYSQNPDASTPFLGYSPSGTVSSKVVFANFGTTQDFEYLSSINVSCEGMVVVMRYGEIYRGDKVANAALYRASAALIYSDPQQSAPDGTSPNKTYPSTTWLPPSGVQRGSILCGTPGDPRTPGWPSCEGGCEAYSKEELEVMGLLPSIPAVPISYGNAEKILQGMGGPVAPATWQGAIPGLVYRVGPGPVEVGVTVESNITVATVRDVIGVLKGAEEPDRYVIVGNHRDAWVFGAADPNSGTACLLELARVLHVLHSQGWVPRRTIVLASWDGEEHNLIGSTEWVEKNLPLLSARAVAYLNVDVAVSGAGFDASATPQLDDLVRHIISMVQDPDGPPGQSVLDTWRTETNSTVPELGRLGGGGSDFAAFLQHAGIPAMDLTYGGEYPMYHSVYDNFHWMSTFGDPGFKRHVAVTQIMLGIAMMLSTAEIVPMNYSAYAVELLAHVLALNETLSTQISAGELTLQPLLDAVDELEDAAEGIGKEHEVLLFPGVGGHRSRADGIRKRAGGNLLPSSTKPREMGFQGMNERLIMAERGFLDAQGLSENSNWYKHLIYGPESNNGYGTDIFPALQDSTLCFKEAQRDREADARDPLRELSEDGSEDAREHHLFRTPFPLVSSDEEIVAGKSGGKRESRRQRSRKMVRRVLESRREEKTTTGVSDRECSHRVQHEIFRVARAVGSAARILRGSLF